MRPFSPAVKLSPMASNLEAESITPVSVTLNAQAAWRPAASLALQLTDVVPSGNVDPDAFAQVTFTGAVPPVTAGGSNVTAWDPVVTPRTVTSAGQTIWGG